MTRAVNKPTQHHKLYTYINVNIFTSLKSEFRNVWLEFDAVISWHNILGQSRERFLLRHVVAMRIIPSNRSKTRHYAVNITKGSTVLSRDSAANSSRHTSGGTTCEESES